MGLNYLLARKKSSSSLYNKLLKASFVASNLASDLKLREANTYKRTSYKTMLASKSSFIDEFDKGIKKASNNLY